MRWLFNLITLITFPIGWLVSQALLAIVYFGLFTPVAVVFRLVGRDVLGRKRQSEKTTYWQPYPPVTDLLRYFQQF